MEHNFSSNLKDQLEEKGRLLTPQEPLDRTVSRAGPTSEKVWARDHGGARDGKVIDDSGADAAGMENHLDRPEVKEAFEGRMGSSIRQSATMGSSISMWRSRSVMALCAWRCRFPR